MNELRRDLEFKHLLVFGVGGLIGAGIYSLSGYLIVESGWLATIIFVIAGLFSLPTCLVYAEFSSGIPSSGGGYHFISVSVPKRGAFLGGLTFFMAYIAASAFYVVTLARYMLLIFGLDMVLFSSIVMFVFMLLNLRGAKESGNAELVLVVAKIAILLIFSGSILIILRGYSLSSLPRKSVSLSDVLMLATTVFIAFEGYDIIATTGGESKNPKRDVPRAIIITLVVGIVIYLLVVVSMLKVTALFREIMQTRDYEIVIVDIAGYILGAPGLVLMIVGLVLSILSAFNASYYAAIRILYAMAEDGHVPRILSSVDNEMGTPKNAIFVTTVVLFGVVLGSLLLSSIGFVSENMLSPFLGSLSSVAFAIAFAVVDVSLIIYRRKHGPVGDFRTPLYPLTPVLGVVFAVATIYALLMINSMAAAVMLGFLGLGAIYSMVK